MITAIYSFISFGGILTVFPWNLFWFLSAVLYFVIFSLIKGNSVKSVVLGFVCAEVIFDIIWLINYHFNRWYLEYGVGITYGFFMWCILLVVAGVVVTIRNLKKAI